LQRINFKLFLSVFLVFLILFYLGFSIEKVLFPPKIKIIYPPKEFVTKDAGLTIKVKTDSNAEVFINGQSVENPQQDGLFTQKIELLPGLNIINISAKKKYSKKNTIKCYVVLE